MYSCLDATCYSGVLDLLSLSSVFCFLPRVICCLQSIPLPPCVIVEIDCGVWVCAHVCVHVCVGHFMCFCMSYVYVFLNHFTCGFVCTPSIRVRVWQLQVSVSCLLCFLPPYCSRMRSLKLEPFQSSKLLRSELHGFLAVQVVDWRDKPGSPQSCLSSPTWPWSTLCQTGPELVAGFPPWIPRAKSVVL